MTSHKPFFSAIFMLLIFCPRNSISRTLSDPPCAPFSCGNLHNIVSPFHLETDPMNCSDSGFVLQCQNNQTTITLNSKKYNVLEIDYSDYSIRIIDPGLQNQANQNCTSFPQFAQTSDYFDDSRNFSPYGGDNVPIVYVSCSSQLNSTEKYTPTEFCSKSKNINNYIAIGYRMSIQDVPEGCSVEMVAWASARGLFPGDHSSLKSLHAAMGYGVKLSWARKYLCRDCERSGRQCFFDDPLKPSPDGMSCSSPICYRGGFGFPFTCTFNIYRTRVLTWSGRVIVSIIGIRLIFGIIFLIGIVTYRWRRRHLADNTIEDFLNRQNKLQPINYSYAEIKKMTNDFREKLGAGANGTVYKGKLRSGPLVAVKMMEKSSATSKEFITEVATIGRIHHVNVVQLIGFCIEGLNRALVYEFMPNGSLEKHVLSYRQMFEVALGVARGIDYLHRGCNVQILHFDIKPHNILLDENFSPKISDFGLAKLYPTDNSVVSLTAARGTVGYMAPELFYKNIGGVSYKADVYSFGMLLIEMVSKRKNVFADESSQIHFPTWIYDQIKEGKCVVTGDVSEEEREVVEKMIIVALWCIQMKPADRPPMNRIVEMLEGDSELIQMPPRPFVVPRDLNVDAVDSSFLAAQG